MRRATVSQFIRPSPSALLGAAAACAAGFALCWWLSSQPSGPPPAVTAVVRQRQLDGRHAELPTELVAADLLRPEHLASALDESHFAENGPLTSADLTEQVRTRVRVDFGVPNEAGIRSTTIRWLGDPAEPAAARLINVLARRLAAQSSTSDLGMYQREYDAAHAEVNAAAEAVEQARQRLDLALIHSHSTASPANTSTPRPRAAVADYPATPFATAPAQEDVLLARQRLIELEARREALAERLMPEHPQMKAIDEKIEALRSSLASTPTAPIEHLPFVTHDKVVDAEAPTLAPDLAGIAEVRQLGQALLAAQQRYKNALSRERACWQAVAAARGQLVAEVEPATASRVGQGTSLAGYRWFFSLLTGAVFGGLAMAIWPSPSHTFANVDEVRAFTRLPVVVIERAVLN